MIGAWPLSRSERFVEMVVHALALEAKNNTPVILLRDEGARLVLPIWIAQPQAQAVLASLEERTGRRPLTHELFGHCFEALDVRLKALQIYALVKSTFYARFQLEDSAGLEVSVECRPSDGISVALRVGCPIQVERGVLRAAHTMGSADDEEPPPEAPFVFDDDAAGLQRLIDGLAAMEPADFGKFET